MEDTLDPLTLDQLEDALRHIPPRKARGIEAAGQRDVWRLPEAGRSELLALFHAIESQVAWLRQWLPALISLPCCANLMCARTCLLYTSDAADDTPC
eukprot:8899528-Pyramimonas_sp.AAC.1